MTTLKESLKVLVACSFMLTSCLTAKKVDNQVAKLFGEIPQQQKKKSNETIFITSSLITSDSKISTSETKTSDVLPLFFYNQWDYKNTCTLNPQIPINNFIKTVQSVANKELRSKLNGQKLEINIDKIPNVFAIDDKAHLIFFGYAFGWDDVSIMADNIDMVVTYKISKDNVESKRGTITIPYIYDKKKLGMFKSWKKATTEYLVPYQ